MRLRDAVSAVIVSIGMITAPACSGLVPAAPTPRPAAAQPTQAPVPTKAPVATATRVPAATATPAHKLEDFDPTKFDRPTQITNVWLPLKPGTRFVYEGHAVDDSGALVPHRIVVNVTDLTKVIGGVRALVTWDLDYSADKLEEAELAFYAQDKEGNVWRLGEYPEVYKNGGIEEAPTWLHGLEDARAGIMMKANPQLGTPSYAQGWGPAVNWTDVAKVDQTGQKTCVRVNCYEDVLVIAETSQSEPDAQQLKYYARDVGNVRVAWRGGGEKTKESLELTKIEQLSPEALAEVRAKALELEKSAYTQSKDVYAKTQPLEQAR